MKGDLPVAYFVEVQCHRRKDFGRNLRFRGRIPFVPVAGLMMCPVDGDNYRKVESVYWKPDVGLEVFFEFEATPIIQDMLALGWSDADKEIKK
jgi:sporulation-control protein spo0M